VSFELKPQEQVNRGLRRLVRKELRAARRALDETHPPTPDGIHEARKSLKKVVAIVALIDADDGRGVGRADKRLRKIARTLSRVRDADAMFEIVRKLHRSAPRLMDTQSVKALRMWLSGQRSAALAAAGKKHRWHRLEDDLCALRRKAKRWQPSHRAFGVLSRGIRDSLRRGKKALARAARRQRADDFHRWRKQIKSLWYELRLVERVDARVGRDVRALHRAETWLGDDHNVVVLCAALSRDGPDRTRPISIEQLKAAADQYHARARRRAITSVRHIYEQQSDQYLRELKRAWRAWHHRQQAR
jgi:hypothetical protein